VAPAQGPLEEQRYAIDGVKERRQVGREAVHEPSRPQMLNVNEIELMVAEQNVQAALQLGRLAHGGLQRLAVPEGSGTAPHGCGPAVRHQSDHAAATLQIGQPLAISRALCGQNNDVVSL
jgi:hypothetical protein